MNLEQLKVFHTLAEKRNFSETAKLLHISQPTVTMQIKSLEENYQTKLFERTTKQVTLTEAGHVLYQYTAKILNLLDSAEKEITLLAQTIQGELKIGASLTIGEYVLPKIMGQFKKEFPQVKLLMEMNNSEQIIQSILDDMLHIGFIEAPLDHPKLNIRPFMEDELVVISSGSHPHPLLKNRNEISTDELMELPVILREPGSGTRRVMEDALKNYQISPDSMQVVLELGSTEAIKAAVESGLGISIISRSAIKKENAMGTLKEIRIKNVTIRRSFYTVYHKERVLKRPEDAFLSFFNNMNLS